MPFSFLNAGLLLGALCFLIPLLIHLLNRRKLQTIEWGPMHLLREARREKRRRPRIEQWLLLLLRMLIPVLLALGLAVPAIQNFGLFSGSPARATAYVVDNSASMRTLEGTVTRMNGARTLLESIGKKRPSGSTSYLLVGGDAETVENDNPLAVTETPASDGGLGAGGRFVPAEAILEGSATLDASDEAARELVVVSDFQTQDWTGPRLESLRDALARVAELDPAPAVTFLRAGRPAAEDSANAAFGVGNLSINHVESTVPIVAPKQTFRLVVNLKRSATGTLPNDFRVELRGADGALLDESECRCLAGASTQVIFNARFDEPGDYPLEIRIRTSDALAVDNVRHLVVPVWPSLKVLLIEGNRTSARIAPVDFLEFALQPNRVANLPGIDLVNVHKARFDNFNENNLKDVRVVALVGAPRLDDNRRQLLETFVTEGGGLLVLPSPDLDATWYQETFHRGGEGILPTGYGERERLDAGEGVVIDGDHLYHAVSSYFRDPRNGKVASGRVRTYLRLDGSSEDVATILQLRNGSPLLLEKETGEGRVAQLATSLDPDWANLSLQPFFVPLLQRLVVHLAAGTTFPANVEAGADVSVEIPHQWNEEEVIFIDPTGKETTLSVPRGGNHERRTASVPAQAGVGFYQFKRPPDRGKERRFVATSVPADDSELMTEPEVEALVAELGVGYAASLDQYRKLDDDRSFGRVIWRWFAYALLAFLFLELFLQQWMARTR